MNGHRLDVVCARVAFMTDRRMAMIKGTVADLASERDKWPINKKAADHSGQGRGYCGISKIDIASSFLGLLQTSIATIPSHYIMKQNRAFSKGTQAIGKPSAKRSAATGCRTS